MSKHDPRGRLPPLLKSIGFQWHFGWLPSALFERESTHPRTTALTLLTLVAATQTNAEGEVKKNEATGRCEDLQGGMEAAGEYGPRPQSTEMGWDEWEPEGREHVVLEKSGGETGGTQTARRGGAGGERLQRCSGSGQEAGSAGTGHGRSKRAKPEGQAHRVSVYRARDWRGDGANGRRVVRVVVCGLCCIGSGILLPIILAVRMKKSCGKNMQENSILGCYHCPLITPPPMTPEALRGALRRSGSVMWEATLCLMLKRNNTTPTAEKKRTNAGKQECNNNLAAHTLPRYRLRRRHPLHCGQPRCLLLHCRLGLDQLLRYLLLRCIQLCRWLTPPASAAALPLVITLWRCRCSAAGSHSLSAPLLCRWLTPPTSATALLQLRCIQLCRWLTLPTCAAALPPANTLHPCCCSAAGYHPLSAPRLCRWIPPPTRATALLRAITRHQLQRCLLLRRPPLPCLLLCRWLAPLTRAAALAPLIAPHLRFGDTAGYHPPPAPLRCCWLSSHASAAALPLVIIPCLRRCPAAGYHPLPEPLPCRCLSPPTPRAAARPQAITSSLRRYPAIGYHSLHALQPCRRFSPPACAAALPPNITPCLRHRYRWSPQRSCQQRGHLQGTVEEGIVRTALGGREIRAQVVQAERMGGVRVRSGREYCVEVREGWAEGPIEVP